MKSGSRLKTSRSADRNLQDEEFGMLHIPPTVFHEWLGISREDPTPTIYRVFGLTNLESDQGVIEFVSGWRIAFVETKRKGADGEVAQELLGRMKAARRILLDAEKKSAYDSELQTSNPQLKSPPPLDPSDDARRWLGVVSESAVPDDRRLLGISDTETSLSVIKTQFDQRMLMLRELEKAYTDTDQVRVQRLVSMLAKAERRVVKSLEGRADTKSEISAVTQTTAIAIRPTPEIPSGLPIFQDFVGPNALQNTSISDGPAERWRRMLSPGVRFSLSGAAVFAVALAAFVFFGIADPSQKDRKSPEMASSDSTESESESDASEIDQEMELAANNESTSSPPEIRDEHATGPKSPPDVPDPMQASMQVNGLGSDVADTEAGIAHLRQVLLSNSWHYRDSHFPPGGEEFRFNANGKFHYWNWNYWVVAPREIRVHYDKNNMNSATGVLLRFNEDLTRFESPEWKDTRDRSGKAVRITGWRHETSNESITRQTAMSAAATAANPEAPVLVTPESFLEKELLVNGGFEKGASNRRASTEIENWTMESGSPFITPSIPFYRLVESNLNGKATLERYFVEAFEGRIFLVAVGKVTATRYEVSQDVDLSLFSKMIESGNLVLTSTSKFRSYQLGKAGNPPKIIGSDTAEILLEFRSSKSGQVLSGGADSGNKQSVEWDDLSVSVSVPQKARWVRVRLIGRSKSKYANGVLFDDVSLKASMQ